MLIKHKCWYFVFYGMLLPFLQLVLNEDFVVTFKISKQTPQRKRSRPSATKLWMLYHKLTFYRLLRILVSGYGYGTLTCTA